MKYATGSQLLAAMNPRRRTNRLICNSDWNAFAVIMTFVVFVALIVVMVTPDNPPYTWGQLPRVHHPKIVGAWTWGANRSDAMIAMVARDGNVYFRSETLSPQELAPKIRQCLRTGSERRFYLRADARVRYEAVKPVLEAIQSAGVEDISVLTDESKDPPSVNNQR